MFENDRFLEEYQEFRRRRSQNGIAAILGLLGVIVLCFEPFLIGLLLLPFGRRYKWKPWLLIVAGIVLLMIAAMLGFIHQYIDAVILLVSHYTEENFWSEIMPQAALLMLPASIGASLIFAGVLLWLLIHRPELLPIPVKERSPEENVVHSIRKLNSIPEIEDGVGLGLDDEGKPVYLLDKEANMHCFVSGATGAGKTNTLTVILESAIRRGKPVIVVDGKGDPGFLEDLRRMAEAYGRKFQGFSYTGNVHYNPFRHGKPTELKDKMIAIEEWTDPYYKRAAERYLQLVFRVLTLSKKKIDLHTVQNMLIQKNLMEAVKKLRNIM